MKSFAWRYPLFSFFGGKCWGRKHRRDLFLKYCPLQNMQWVSSFRLVILSMELDKTSYWCNTINCFDFLVHERQQPEIGMSLNRRISLAIYDFKMNLWQHLKRDYSDSKIYLIFRITLYSQHFIYLGQAILKGTFIALDEISTTIFFFIYTGRSIIAFYSKVVGFFEVICFFFF